MDYRARTQTYGGSTPGRDARRMPDSLKLALQLWAKTSIGLGSEDRFIRWEQAGLAGRWTPRIFEPFVGIAEHFLPDEVEAYLGATDRHPARYERATNIYSNRHHKMFYDNDGRIRGRDDFGGEHVCNWSNARLARAFSRLVEVGFPY